MTIHTTAMLEAMMAKSQKQTGYLVKIEAFVPAELTDSQKLVDTQTEAEAMIETFKNAGGLNARATVTPTRR